MERQYTSDFIDKRVKLTLDLLEHFEQWDKNNKDRVQQAYDHPKFASQDPYKNPLHYELTQQIAIPLYKTIEQRHAGNPRDEYFAWYLLGAAAERFSEMIAKRMSAYSLYVLLCVQDIARNAWEQSGIVQSEHNLTFADIEDRIFEPEVIIHRW